MITREWRKESAVLSVATTEEKPRTPMQVLRLSRAFERGKG